VLDVALLLDMSDSAEYDLITQFSRTLSIGLSINNDAVRVGVVVFSGNVSRVIPLNQFITRQRNLIQALNFARRHGKATNIQVAILSSRSQLIILRSS